MDIENYFLRRTSTFLLHLLMTVPLGQPSDGALGFEGQNDFLNLLYEDTDDLKYLESESSTSPMF